MGDTERISTSVTNTTMAGWFDFQLVASPIAIFILAILIDKGTIRTPVKHVVSYWIDGIVGMELFTNNLPNKRQQMSCPLMLFPI